MAIIFKVYLHLSYFHSFLSISSILPPGFNKHLSDLGKSQKLLKFAFQDMDTLQKLLEETQQNI